MKCLICRREKLGIICVNCLCYKGRNVTKILNKGGIIYINEFTNW